MLKKLPVQWGFPVSKVINTTIMVLTMMIFSGTAMAATSQTSTTEVTMNVAEAIEVVSWPDATMVLHAAAVPGEAVVSSALHFTVRCNSNWGIQVKSDEATGKLREFSPASSEYVADGRMSQRSLEWGTATTGPWTTLSSVSTTTHSSMIPTNEVGSTVSLYLRYIPGFNDVPLTAGRTYRIALTYTAAIGY